MGGFGGGGALTLFWAAIAMGVVAAGWVIVPLIARRFALLHDLAPEGSADAEARRRVALASLKEVEYDRVSGKLDERDYRQLKAQLEREALTAIAAAEATVGAEPPRTGPVPSAAQGPMQHDCGFVNPPGSRFCSGCGRRLG